jgi:hypothetical protein
MRRSWPILVSPPNSQADSPTRRALRDRSDIVSSKKPWKTLDMNEDAVWAILANELEECGPMSDFLERSGAKLVDRPVPRTSHRPDPIRKAAVLKRLRTTGR